MNKAISSIIDSLDTTAAITVGKTLCMRAIVIGLYAASAIIRERELERTDSEANSQLVGRNVSAHEQAPAPRDPPAGLDNRKTPHERLNDAAKLYSYGLDVCTRLGSSQWDEPQSIANRIQWQINMLKQEVQHTPKPTGTSLAARAAARNLQTRNEEQLAFYNEWGSELIETVEDAFTQLVQTDNEGNITGSVDIATDHINALRGFDRYQVLVAMVDGLARRAARLFETCSKLRPGSTLARSTSSELAVVEGSWRAIRAIVIDLEHQDAAIFLEVIGSGRNFRDLAESDKLMRELGVEIE
jgi:hypothetical protein